MAAQVSNPGASDRVKPSKKSPRSRARIELSSSAGVSILVALANRVRSSEKASSKLKARLAPSLRMYSPAGCSAFRSRDKAPRSVIAAFTGSLSGHSSVINVSRLSHPPSTTRYTSKASTFRVGKDSSCWPTITSGLPKRRMINGSISGFLAFIVGSFIFLDR